MGGLLYIDLRANTFANIALAYMAKAARIDESNIVTLSASGCGWRYYLCAATATGAAIACHAAIIAPIAGLGTPAAVAICGTAQVYAMVVCSDNYCD